MSRIRLTKGFVRSAGTVTVGLVCLLACLTCLGGCQEPPGVEQLETTIDYRVQRPDEARGTRTQLLADIRGADERIWAAVAGDAMDAEIGRALKEAHERGVDVQLVADADDKDSEGFDTLQEAGVRMEWGDGALEYLPDPTLAQVVRSCGMNEEAQTVTCSSYSGGSPCRQDDADNEGVQGAICRPGAFNLMSHRFFIIDKRTVWNLGNGLEGIGETDGDSAGLLGWKATSERIREDFEREFRQLRGGVFATNLDEYNGPNKSTTDPHIDYFSDQGVVTIRFNPQERLLKHVIDHAYRARSSVKIVSSQLRNPFLLDALEYKAKHDFHIDIIVGEGTQPEGPAMERLKALGAKTHPAGRSLPTLVLVDTQTKNENTRQWPRAGMVLSHPLWHAQPLKLERPAPDSTERDPDDEVIVYPSDHFVDGNLWTIFEYESNRGRDEIAPGQPTMIRRLMDYYGALDQNAKELK